MNNVRSSMPTPTPKRDPHLAIPKTRAEFKQLTYSQRLQLEREHPDVYRRFTSAKRWEWED